MSTVNPGPRICASCGCEIAKRTREPGQPRMVTVCLAVYVALEKGGTTKSTPGVRICTKCLSIAIASPWSNEGQKLFGDIIGRLAALYRSTEGAKAA